MHKKFSIQDCGFLRADLCSPYFSYFLCSFIACLRGISIILFVSIKIISCPQTLTFELLFCRSAESVEPISWATRMKIAVDVARGLSFLHGLHANVIYRDLKASNILLDAVC